ncbi:MAG: helix-turn-helix transcriptional regulator [Oligoflexia bacterium]|nr:helix-turn-helix transcriptional regulator [Oligoflexia bacterium]
MSNNCNEYFINISLIKELIIQNNLKLWWIAEQMNISSRTMSRWFSGKTNKVKLENILSLSKVLNVNYQDLIVKDDSIIVSSPSEKKRYLSKINFNLFLQNYSLNNQWKMLEQMLKTLSADEIPLHQIGEFYLLLARIHMERDEYNESLKYIERALEIATKTKNDGILTQLYKLMGQNYLWLADWKMAHQCLKKVLTIHLNNNNNLLIGDSYCTLGLMYHEMGDLKNALKYYDQTLDILKKDEDDESKIYETITLSNTYLFRGSLYIENESFDLAKDDLDMVLNLSVNLHDVRAIADAKIFLSQYYLYKQNLKLAEKTYIDGERIYKNVNYFPNPIQIIYKALLQQGLEEFQDAVTTLIDGLDCIKIPLYKGRCYEILLSFDEKYVPLKEKKKFYKLCFNDYQKYNVPLKLKQLEKNFSQYS